jgi:pyruvate dehydrogenase E2 component (dihydrolipoamide acetyltransferase)
VLSAARGLGTIEKRFSYTVRFPFLPEILMPKLSDSMEEGTVVRWLKSDGDEVAAGEDLVEIETDKATMAYEAAYAGTLRIAVPEGTSLPVGRVIATIGENAGPTATAAAAATAAPPLPVAPSGGNGGHPAAQRRVSPVARRVARELGIDLAAVAGSGLGGRIVKADVRAVSGGAEEAPAAPVSAARGDVEVVALSRTQQVVARRMAESKATVPEFTLRVDVDMADVVSLRRQLKGAADPDRPVPSLNDFVVKACALALRDHPRANGAYRDGEFHLHSRVNVGIAVAAIDSLLVPTIFDADGKSVGQIAAEARMLAEKARAGSITPPEVAGGTFTVSNLGSFGVAAFTAVINAPQAAILAVGEVADRAVVRGGQLVARPMMSATLSCDHRILYGADAAAFLRRVRELLEAPLWLVV